MQEPAGIRLALSSRPHNVAVVRAAITGIAEALGFDEELISDLKTGVSEACNNVSLHAYPDAEIGPMWVDLDCSHDGIEATVTDSGRGITRISSDEHHMGLGIAVINALSDRAQFRRPDGGGAQVTMWFQRELDELTPAAEAADDAEDSPPELFPETDGQVVLWCTGATLQGAVLSRVLWYLAASSHFSLDGISAVRNASAALASHVQRGGIRGWAGARIASTARRLDLTVGPLAPLDYDPALVESVDTLESQGFGGQELLHITVGDRRA